MADKREIIDIMKKYSAAYPSSGLKKEGVELYVKALERFDSSEIDFAMNVLLTKCKFFPTIAEIHEQISPRKENGGEYVNWI